MMNFPKPQSLPNIPRDMIYIKLNRRSIKNAIFEMSFTRLKIIRK